MEAIEPYLSPEVIEALGTRSVQIALGVTALVLVLGCCRIFARAGRHPGLGFLMLIPVLNVLPFLYLAFGPWPVERELRLLRKAQKASVKAEHKLSANRAA